MVERGQQRTERASREPEPAPVSPARGQVPGDVRDVSFHTAMRGYERREVDRYVQRVNRVIAELEIARSPESAVRHALDRVGEQTSGILQRARETADEIIHTARSEAEETTNRGRAEGRDIVAAARAEVERLLADGETQARERVQLGEREFAARRKQAEEALAEADATLAAAQSQAAELVAQAQAEAEQMVTRADTEAVERRAREEERLEELRGQAKRDVLAMQADRDAVVQERQLLVEQIHELAARLDALADSGASEAIQASPAAEDAGTSAGEETASVDGPKLGAPGDQADGERAGRS